jgi:hypothetical protein
MRRLFFTVALMAINAVLALVLAYRVTPMEDER